MRNEMQSWDVADWGARLAAYIPKTESEKAAQVEILAALRQDGDQVLCRSRIQGHVTCSGFVMNPQLDKILMVYHNIYDSFAWTGGHADGCNDFLFVAVKEAKEETGVQKPYPQTGKILSLDVLPVKAHEKKGKPVSAHVHYNVTYGLIAEEKEKFRVKPDENSDVQWIPIAELPSVCKEAHMLPVYEKCIQRMATAAKAQQEVIPQLAEPILTWYPSHARELPWRRTKSPYHVWLSEIMLQQTRVEAVKSYYQRFLEQFPTVEALAKGTQDQVNKCWEGLGYYSRAANLRKAAMEIMTVHDGAFPQEWEAVHRLPGVGEYTAGAICSICYGLPTPAVDGNVLRVISRVTDCFCPIDRPAYKAAVTAQLRQVYQAHAKECGTLTQALMELGATVCLSNGQPLCDSCPLAALCLGRENDDVLRLPQRTAKKPRRKEQRTVFLLCWEGRYAVRKRTEKGLLHGLWEFPNVEGMLTPEDAIAQASSWGCQPTELEKTQQRQHIFTHVEWEMFGVTLHCASADRRFLWKTPAEIAREISLPTAFRQFCPTVS